MERYYGIVHHYERCPTSDLQWIKWILEQARPERSRRVRDDDDRELAA